MLQFNNILCVMESGDTGQPALERAVALAESHQARLTVATTVPPLPASRAPAKSSPRPAELRSALERQQEARAESELRPYRQRLDIQHRLLKGPTFLEVIRQVLRDRHDLVIKCPESPSWLDRFFSGDDMHLLRKCPCPVWFVKSEQSPNFRRMLAAVDVGDGYPSREMQTRQRLNLQILDMACSLAVAEAAELHIVHAWESINEMASGIAFSPSLSKQKLAELVEQEREHQHQLLDELVQSYRSSGAGAAEALDYLGPQTHLLKGDARRTIPELARHQAVDCIVMGTVARTGISGLFMGNTAETILEQIDCSVLAIKPQGFSTPVAPVD